VCKLCRRCSLKIAPTYSWKILAPKHCHPLSIIKWKSA
jgi:hypothetical protein